MFKEEVKINLVFNIITLRFLQPQYCPYSLIHNRLYDNKLNDYCNHASVLDHDFDSGIERLTYCNILGKYKPDRIHIVGNNSNEYNGNDEADMNIYNKVFINNLNESNWSN